MNVLGLRSRLSQAAVIVTLVAGAMLAYSAPAMANAWWRTTTRTAPAQLPTKGPGFITAQAINLGNVPISAKATPVTITDTLPEGVTVTKIVPIRQNAPNPGGREPVEENPEFKVWTCTHPEPATRVVVTCVFNTEKGPSAKELLLEPYEDLELRMNVAVGEGHGPASSNELTVEGGREVTDEATVAEGPQVPTPQPKARTVGFSDGPTGFALEDEGFAVSPETDEGTPVSQAGAHPFQLTTSLYFDQTIEGRTTETSEGVVTEENPAAPAPARNLSFNLPPGLLGNVTAASECSERDFFTIGAGGGINECPGDSAIGVSRVTILEPENLAYHTFTVPVFNLTPAAGEPARFGFYLVHLPVTLDTRVRTEGDYGVEVKVSDTTELAQLLSSEVTLWGTPGAESHDNARGWSCVAAEFWRNNSRLPVCSPPEQRSTEAFLSLPTACPTNLMTSVTGVSWPIKAPGELGAGKTLTLEGPREFRFPELPQGITGCAALPFTPSIAATPTSSEANAPTGLAVDVHVPQATTRESDKLAESAVRATTVAFPAGMQLSPSAANGLEACSIDQIGYLGAGGSEDPYASSTTEKLEEPLRFTTAEAACPKESKVGTVTVKTPLLGEELHGNIYLAAQEANPFGSLLAVYIVVESEKLGLRIKLAGEVKADPVTGQITSTFLNTPQVPFEDFKVDLNSGPRASLASPPTCGTYTTSASFAPWSGGASQPSTSDPNEFSLVSGPGGSGCANPLPFAPAFTAGSTVLQAGAFTPFTVTINRPDTDQALKTVSVTLPPGAAAMLKSATQCPEPQASQGTCGPDSLIGHATAVSGLGPNPYTVNGGRVYITGPYNGAPFGLSIVTPAVAGPFNLGNVVVRSTVNVDRTTAQVTIGTALPTMVSSAEHPNTGIPLQLRSVNVVVDRPNFEFNPTNCTPMSINGTLGGADGASHAVSAPFQVANCSALPFKPKLTASTQGNASKANGASLTVKVESTPGQANIAKTRLVLPIALPSRLTTIQKACLAATFEANPAACPEGSNIGTATVHTPVLKSTLSGPAYLVSHGNAAFPDVEFVLQGEGITLILDGQTDIKKGITTSTFNAVPDAPVTTFETTLPEGPHSALTSNVAESKKFNLCGTKLVMPTTITGQNGAVIQQETKIPVTGCKGVLGTHETKAQKLKKALKACRKKFKHNKAKRAKCEKQAHKKYGPKKAKKHSKKHK